MARRHVFLLLSHFLATSFIINILYSILPTYVSNCFFKFSNFLMYICVSQLTLRISKKIIFRQKLRSDRKAVLITGCARGIGNVLAKHLDSKGFYVFAGCKDPNSPGANDLRRHCSSRLQVFHLDVTNSGIVQGAFQFVKDNLGPNDLWAVINNAGIMKGSMLELTSIQDFKDTLEVNALGPVRVTKAFLPLLRHSPGRVINIASVAGRLAFPILIPYSMSKFACVGFSESLRYELDFFGVQVISIEPEVFETDMTVNFGEGFNAISTDVDENVKKVYLQTMPAVKSTFNTIFPPCQSMRKLIEAVECAVSLKYPDSVYKVCRSTGVRAIWIFLDVLPAEFKVFIVRKVLNLFGLPNLEKVQKNN